LRVHWEKSCENLYFSKKNPILFSKWANYGKKMGTFWEKDGKISGKVQNFPMIFPVHACGKLSTNPKANHKIINAPQTYNDPRILLIDV